MIDVIQYILLVLWLAYMVYVAKSMHKMEKRRNEAWHKHFNELKRVRKLGNQINENWQKELNLWRSKREQLEDAINKRDELLNKKRRTRRGK